VVPGRPLRSGDDQPVHPSDDALQGGDAAARRALGLLPGRLALVHLRRQEDLCAALAQAAVVQGQADLPEHARLGRIKGSVAPAPHLPSMRAAGRSSPLFLTLDSSPRTFFVPGCCTKSRRKRDLSAEGELLALGTADDDLCPAGLTSCPIAGAGPGAFECLDPKSELESCGGCTAMGQGEDCTAIGHAKSVGCEDGVCKGSSFRFAPHDSPLHHTP